MLLPPAGSFFYLGIILTNNPQATYANTIPSAEDEEDNKHNSCNTALHGNDPDLCVGHTK